MLVVSGGGGSWNFLRVQAGAFDFPCLAHSTVSNGTLSPFGTINKSQAKSFDEWPFGIIIVSLIVFSHYLSNAFIKISYF